MSEHTPNAGGIGFTWPLALIFITLKLLGVITWSWWWVLSPIWIPLALLAAILGFVGIVAIAAKAAK